jgi:L-aspartate oxidase
MESLYCDVLVIGSGLAGISAALEALLNGVSVTILSAQDASSWYAQGGIAAAFGSDDEPSLHEKDTISAGIGLCNREAVKILTNEGGETIKWLVQHGVKFDLDAETKGPALALEAAHGKARVLHAGGDDSGRNIMLALQKYMENSKEPKLKILHKTSIEYLLRDSEEAVGAVVDADGERLVIGARATILATGGYAAAYSRTTNASITTGRGILEALRVGATLVDMEFVQFHPTTFAGKGTPFLITEAIRGAGAYICNTDGVRFLFETDMRGELSPRAVVSKAIAEYLSQHQEPYVYLDTRHLNVNLIEEEFPGFMSRLKEVGIDPFKELVPISPAAHYTMGGILTDLWGQTSIKGLYAAGECARTGVHGANRLASNSLLEAAVFGRRAGKHAATHLLEQGEQVDGIGYLPRWSVPTEKSAILQANEIKEDLLQYAGVLRNEAGLKQGLDILWEDSPGNEDTRNLQELGRMITTAALLRQETRGAQVRTDFPKEDELWGNQEIRFELDSEGWPTLSTVERET